MGSAHVDKNTKIKTEEVRAGPAKSLPARWIGHAPLNTMHSEEFFDTTIMHNTTNVFCPRDMADIKIREVQKCSKLGLKNVQARLSVLVHMRSKYDVKI